MAWLTTYTDTNKILDEETAWDDALSIGGGVPPVSLTRAVTESKYRYVAMAKDSAQTAASTLRSSAPSGTTRQVMIRRNGPSNGYDICVSDIVYGAWAEV